MKPGPRDAGDHTGPGFTESSLTDEPESNGEDSRSFESTGTSTTSSLLVGDLGDLGVGGVAIIPPSLTTLLSVAIFQTKIDVNWLQDVAQI
jgi:hypothetical protein